MKSLEPRCKLTSLRPLLKEAFRKQLKETALRVSQKKIESPPPFSFLIFQSVNATSSQEINIPIYEIFFVSIYVHRSQSNKTVLIVLHDSQFSIDPIPRRSTRKEKQSLPRPTINKIPPFESGKRYPQNVSINSNFTVDESFEARNIGFALSSETGCFSSRLRDERRNAMHLSWRRCFPET